MVDHDDDQAAAEIAAPAFHDRYADTLALLAAVMSAKETRKKLLRLRKLDRDIAAASTRLAAAQVETEQTKAALAEREAAIEERERVLDARATEFASSLAD